MTTEGHGAGPWNPVSEAEGTGPHGLPSQPSAPVAFPPAPPPVWGGPQQQQQYGYPPTGPAYSYSSVGDPISLFASGLRKLAAARALAWCLVPAYASVAIAGVITLAESENEFATDLYDAGQILLGLGAVAWLALAIALWACLAVWCSKMGGSAKAAGNAYSSSSHMAWWGIFVPIGNLFVPFLAYKDAAKYVLATARHGHLQNGGDGWKAASTPGLVTAWWLLHTAAFLCFNGYGSVDGGEEVAEGMLLLLTGLFGVLAAVVGALAFGSLLDAARRAGQR